MEKAVMVVEVLRPSLPSLVSLVPSLVLGSKTTPPVGSKRRGAGMNQPQRFRVGGGRVGIVPVFIKPELPREARGLLGVGHNRAVLRAAQPCFWKILKIGFWVPNIFADDQVAVLLLVGSVIFFV